MQSSPSGFKIALFPSSLLVEAGVGGETNVAGETKGELATELYTGGPLNSLFGLGQVL